MCNRSFRDTTGTPLHQLHKKEKIKKYIEALQKGMSIRKAAAFVGISKNTSFAWRHKLLSSLTNIPQPEEKNSLAGALIIKLPYSDKGRKKEPETNTLATKTLLLASESEIWLQKIKNTNSTIDIARTIAQRLSKGFIITKTDNILSRAVKHQTNAKIIKTSNDSSAHIKLVQSIQVELKNWMDKFKGVATKYLQHYWSWFVSLKRASQYKNGQLKFTKDCLKMHSLQQYYELKQA